MNDSSKRQRTEEGIESEKEKKCKHQHHSDSCLDGSTSEKEEKRMKPSTSSLTCNSKFHSLPSKPISYINNIASTSTSTTPDHLATLPRLSVSDWSNKKAPGFQKPCQIASFSYDAKRALHHDDRSIAEYHEPFPQPGSDKIDLNRGIQDWVVRDESVNEHLDSLLFALMNKANQSYSSSSTSQKSSEEETDEIKSKNFDQELDRDRSRANFITWRGMMTRLCTSLYENQQGFDMNLMMIGDTIYIEEHVDSNSLERKRKQMQDEKQRRFTYYGYNFESWCTHQPKNPPNKNVGDSWSGSPNTNIQWCSIIKTSLGNNRIIIGGEVDCMKPKYKSSNQDDVEIEMVELKTSMMIKNQRDESRFEEKMLRFYTQSFLLGVPWLDLEIMQEIFNRHKNSKLWKFPRLVRGKPNAWDPLACLSFADSILNFLRNQLQIAETDSSISSSHPVYRFSFTSPFNQLTLRKLSENEILNEIQGGNPSKDGIERIGFIPKVYYDFANANGNES